MGVRVYCVITCVVNRDTLLRRLLASDRGVISRDGVIADAHKMDVAKWKKVCCTKKNELYVCLCVCVCVCVCAYFDNAVTG